MPDPGIVQTTDPRVVEARERAQSAFASGWYTPSQQQGAAVFLGLHAVLGDVPEVEVAVLEQLANSPPSISATQPWTIQNEQTYAILSAQPGVQRTEAGLGDRRNTRGQTPGGSYVRLRDWVLGTQFPAPGLRSSRGVSDVIVGTTVIHELQHEMKLGLGTGRNEDTQEAHAYGVEVFYLGRQSASERGPVGNSSLSAAVTTSFKYGAYSGPPAERAARLANSAYSTLDVLYSIHEGGVSGNASYAKLSPGLKANLLGADVPTLIAQFLLEDGFDVNTGTVSFQSPELRSLYQELLQLNKRGTRTGPFR